MGHDGTAANSSCSRCFLFLERWLLPERTTWGDVGTGEDVGGEKAAARDDPEDGRGGLSAPCMLTTRPQPPSACLSLVPGSVREYVGGGCRVVAELRRVRRGVSLGPSG